MSRRAERKATKEKLTALWASGYRGPVHSDPDLVPDIREWLTAPLKEANLDGHGHAA